jgi:hypothetical protein
MLLEFQSSAFDHSAISPHPYKLVIHRGLRLAEASLQ